METKPTRFIVMVKDDLSGNWDYISDYMGFVRAQQYKWKVHNEKDYTVALMAEEDFKEWQKRDVDPEEYLYQKLS